MKKLYLITIIVVFMLTQNMVSAEQQNDVQISLNSNSQSNQFTKQFSVDVNVEFLNKELYNSQVYLSYHVYDRNDKELLWEGKRSSINVDKLGQNGHGTVNVDLTSIPDSKDLKYAKIKIDLVDEKNVYWFSKNTKLNMYSESILYQKSFFGKAINNLKVAYNRDIIIFTINLVTFVIFLVVFWWVRKKGFFYN
ncbi:hypothetical protein D3C74_195090 [compost metagenome]